ncbi:MAG: hypothetical protein P4L50_16335 [Anaerolineaceae bacterium]|nr:hypothetical protein [Anaerolineaceae bacterium]
MDKLNNTAPQFPQKSIPPDLAEKLRLNFHRRYYRRKHYHLAVCSVLVAFGLWLVSPFFLALFERLTVPSAGFSLMDNLSAAVLDLANLILMVWNGAVSIQSILLGTLSLSVLVGMICMGAGAIWGIAYFIPAKSAQAGD